MCIAGAVSLEPVAEAAVTCFVCDNFICKSCFDVSAACGILCGTSVVSFHLACMNTTPMQAPHSKFFVISHTFDRIPRTKKNQSSDRRQIEGGPNEVKKCTLPCSCMQS
jgi:hypothetical protein